MSLEIIFGPMFAGKSSKILRLRNRLKSIKWSHCLISHSFDIRYSQESLLINHDQVSEPCFRWSELMSHMNDSVIMESNTIIIDEAQFFPDLVEFVLYLVETLSKEVIVVGLDGDADRKPFGKLLNLVPLADKVTKITALCSECGDGTEALFTFCKKASEKHDQIQVGGADMYMPLCRRHYIQAAK